jgi:hypothetical protein
MRLIILIKMMFLLLSGCAHGPCGQRQLLGQYEATLLQMRPMLDLESKAVDWTLLDRQAQRLTDVGTDLLMDFKQRNPACRALLEKIISEQGIMLIISLEELERVYHDGEGLPQSPEYCFHAKEIIVHPQTIRSMLRDQRQNGADHHSTIIDEHTELLNHFRMFEQDFKKKE